MAHFRITEMMRLESSKGESVSVMFQFTRH